MKIISTLIITALLTGCASHQITNDPNTIVDDLLVLGTMGLYR